MRFAYSSWPRFLQPGRAEVNDVSKARAPLSFAGAREQEVLKGHNMRFAYFTFALFLGWLFCLTGCSPAYVRNALSGFKPTLERVAAEPATPEPLAHEAANGIRVIDKLELTEGPGAQPLDLADDKSVDAFCAARDTQYMVQQALKGALRQMFPFLSALPSVPWANDAGGAAVGAGGLALLIATWLAKRKAQTGRTTAEKLLDAGILAYQAVMDSAAPKDKPELKPVRDGLKTVAVDLQEKAVPGGSKIIAQRKSALVPATPPKLNLKG